MRIDEMPAGREMDKAISQHVFGNTEFCCKDYDDDYHAIKEPNGCFVNYELVPRYSTDMAAAWKIVEKFNKESWWIVIEVFDDATWCKIFAHNKSTNVAVTDNNQMPLAISRCALKVEGVEI